MGKPSIKKRILEVALDLFQQKGFHGVTIDEIVLQAEASKGAFYHYFNSKDALLYEIHDIFISHVLKETALAYDSHNSPIEKLWAMIHAFTVVFDSHSRHISVFYNESNYLSGEYKKEIDQKITDYRRLIEKVITEGKENGYFRSEISPTITALAIIGLVNSTYRWYQKDGILTMEQITVYFDDLIFRAILTAKELEIAKNKQFILNES